MLYVSNVIHKICFFKVQLFVTTILGIKIGNQDKNQKTIKLLI